MVNAYSCTSLLLSLVRRVFDSSYWYCEGIKAFFYEMNSVLTPHGRIGQQQSAFI